MRTELLKDGKIWWRIAQADWANPLDPGFAQRFGGRWNPPRSFPVLYLNEDRVTARLNLRLFISGWPYEPEDLRDDSGPVLVAATLPRKQRVADVHTRSGVASSGLPATYPNSKDGHPVSHETCREVGARAHLDGLRGVRCRSAPQPDGAGRELAWFPASKRSRAREIRTESFEAWFWE